MVEHVIEIPAESYCVVPCDHHSGNNCHEIQMEYSQDYILLSLLIMFIHQFGNLDEKCYTDTEEIC
jgi:hypothetical protein